MVNHKRRKRLLKLLQEHKSVSVPQLVEWLNSSSATVRRDVAWLGERKLLVRTRGGAEHHERTAGALPLASEHFQNSLSNCAGAKRAIARHAASMCHDGDTIIINGGTTTFLMAEFLTHSHLKILTNSFLMAERLLTSTRNEIIVPGGTIYREQNVILSPFDNDVTQHHYASKMFTSVYGLSLLGLMEADPLLIQAEKRLISQAEELVVMADGSKFTRRAGLILCGLNRVSCVITDSSAPEPAVDLLVRSGVKVIVVEPDPPPSTRSLNQAEAEAALFPLAGRSH